MHFMFYKLILCGKNIKFEEKSSSCLSLTTLGMDGMLLR